MHVLETYAAVCGSKISEPWVYETFFPLPMESYILFQAESHMDSRNYAFWQDVIDIIAPIIRSKGIDIVQIGSPNESGLRGTIDLRGQLNLNQQAYLTRRAKMFLGPDVFEVHLASMFDIPMVVLYSNSYANVTGPYFGDKKKQTLIKTYERLGTKKPSFAPVENPKSINLIKPEEIADAVFRTLGIDFVTPFETVFIGDKYCSKVIREVIPDCNGFITNPEAPVEIRADLFYDPQILSRQLAYFHKSILIVNKPIDIQLLKRFKDRLALLVYRIDTNDAPEFVKEVLSLGIQVVLISDLPAEQLQPKRIQYYELGKINTIPKVSDETIESLKKDIDKLYYRSMKMIASNGKIYDSHAALKAGRTFQNPHEYNRVIDTPSFWEELNFCILIKKK